MDSERFSTRIENGVVWLETAADVVLFSFIVQDSISYLDLKVCNDLIVSGCFRSLCRSCRSVNLKYFLNTEEKCRKFFAPRRRLLYSLHLDLPKGRECSLKIDVPETYGVSNFNILDCCTNPNIAPTTLTCTFYSNFLSNFIEEAFNINVPKEMLLKWIVNIKSPLLSLLDIRTASEFLNCVFCNVGDRELFKDFIQDFEIVEWLQEHEQPEIIEVLFYYVNLFGNISLEEDEEETELISECIFAKHYLNIGPILKFISDSAPTFSNYKDYRNLISIQRPRLTDDVMDQAIQSKTVERICRMMQIIYLFIDTQSSNRLEDASEALRLIWSSIPDECVTSGELRDVFGAAFQEEELTNICNFYCKAIGESHENAEPRSLKHLCRVVVRRIFEKNALWIPCATFRTGLPKLLESYLNLEETFAV